MLKSPYACGVCNNNKVILNSLVGPNTFTIAKPDFKKISTTQIIEKQVMHKSLGVIVA